MENKYGKLVARCKVQLMACLGVFVVGLILLGAAVIVLITGITGGFSSGKITAIAILAVLGAALFGHVVLLLTKAGIEVYETGLVITEVKIPYRISKREYPAADIFCLLWDGPGANEINSRAMRKNSNTVEIITDGGRTSYRLSDAYYEETMQKAISDFQDRNHISRDLEKHKKNRY